MARRDDMVAWWMGVRSKWKKREEDDSILDLLGYMVGLDSHHLARV